MGEGQGMRMETMTVARGMVRHNNDGAGPGGRKPWRCQYAFALGMVYCKSRCKKAARPWIERAVQMGKGSGTRRVKGEGWGGVCDGGKGHG